MLFGSVVVDSVVVDSVVVVVGVGRVGVRMAGGGGDELGVGTWDAWKMCSPFSMRVVRAA